MKPDMVRLFERLSGCQAFILELFPTFNDDKLKIIYFIVFMFLYFQQCPVKVTGKSGCLIFRLGNPIAVASLTLIAMILRQVLF